MKLAAFPHQHWAITRDALRSLEARAESMADLIAKGMAAPQPLSISTDEKARLSWNGGNPVVPEIANGVATIEIMGDLIARAPWWAKAYLGVVDPFDVADAVDALAADDSITALVIEMDCCGGTTTGTAEAAAALTRFQGAGKTVEVRAAGTIASAAYWIAAGADKITATATTRVGCLGTLMVLCDDTAMQAAAGCRLEVIASAPGKGLGMDGAITPALRAQSQRAVDALTVVFRDAVAAGRGLSGAKLDAVFTGDYWIGAEALALGLIDAVASPSDELDQPDGNDPAPPPAPPALDGDTDPSPSAKALAPSTQPAAAGDKKESTTMDKALQAALAALTNTHPAHAAALVAHATKDGTTADGLRAFASELVAKATADELAATKAKLAEAEAKARADAEALTKANAEVSKLKGHQQATDPGAGDPADANGMSGEQFLKLSPQARADFRAKGGKLKA